MSPYKEALAAAHKTGVSKCTDAQLMATFCESSIQIAVGAVSPELVWDGAQKTGLTTLELARLASTDKNAVEALMWL
jgi:hypothetical protein